MLQARLLAVAAISIGDVDADDGLRDLDVVIRWYEDGQIARESLVTGGAAEDETKSVLVAVFHGLDADVVRILNRTNQATAVKGDVELARQVVELATREDELRQFL